MGCRAVPWCVAVWIRRLTDCPALPVVVQLRLLYAVDIKTAAFLSRTLGGPRSAGKDIKKATKRSPSPWPSSLRKTCTPSAGWRSRTTSWMAAQSFSLREWIDWDDSSHSFMRLFVPSFLRSFVPFVHCLAPLPSTWTALLGRLTRHGALFGRAADACGVYYVLPQFFVECMFLMNFAHVAVIFSYGLSGSGKTYTVFGPDDPSVPDAWFNVSDPVSNWGLLPRLAFDLFGMQDQTWKFSLKQVRPAVVLA